MQEIALKMQTDQGIEQLVHQLHWGKNSGPAVSKKRTKTGKAKTLARQEQATQPEEAELDQNPETQVRDFKAANKKQISELKKGRNELPRKE
jgi:hypothetical protein